MNDRSHAGAPGLSVSRALNLFYLLTGVVTAFFLLTGGIPLEQWHLLGKGAATKAFCIKSVRISVLCFAVLSLTWAVVFPNQFRKLWVIRGLREFFSWPLRVTVSGAAVVYSAIMIAVGFERHAALDTRAFDLGIFAQALWNTVRGDFLYSSLKGGICLLGDHISPILVALVPLYAIIPDPRVLLVVQPLATAACMVPLAWIAMRRLGDKREALLFVLMFFFYMPARAALREDFHPEVLAEIFILLSFIALETGRLKWFWICAIPVMAAKENFLGVTFFLGAYAFLFKNLRKTGAVMMALSAVLFVFEIKWVAPFFGKAPYFYGVNYSKLPPAQALQILSDGKRWAYVFKVFGPFLFLPVWHPPTAFLTLPVCIQNFLSQNPTLRSLNYHYSAGLTPFLFVSTIYGVGALSSRWAGVRRVRTLVIAVLLTVILTQAGPPEYFYFWQCRNRRTSHTEWVRKTLGAIAPDASVLTHNNLIPQLVNRKHVYQLDYNASPTKAELARKLGVDYVIVDRLFWEPNSAPPDIALAELREAGYQTEAEQGGLTLLRRKIS